MSNRKKARAKKPARPSAARPPNITPRVSTYLAFACSVVHDVLDHCEHEIGHGDETRQSEVNKLRRIVDCLHRASGSGPYGHVWWTIPSVEGAPNRRVPEFRSTFSSCLQSGGRP